MKKTVIPVEEKSVGKTSKVEWILRIGLFGEFVGHGVFALQLKPRFIEMLTAMTGITGATAMNLLSLVGIMDLIVGILALIYPLRLVLIWATAWGFLTALARPIAGDPIWDFIERWANWAVPLALLLIRGWPRKWKELFA
ncbi:hypothetical protein J4421_00160 [Candidatus Woesearchaeota archaeon]|nr:hypothetical protein [Candidatus Woesearchaeota archaeon]